MSTVFEERIKFICASGTFYSKWCGTKCSGAIAASRILYLGVRVCVCRIEFICYIGVFIKRGHVMHNIILNIDTRPRSRAKSVVYCCVDVRSRF